MTQAQKVLLKGAGKSALSAACGLITGLPSIDPTHFSISTVGGWEHLGIAIAWVTFVAEARFWKQWADSGNDPPPPLLKGSAF